MTIGFSTLLGCLPLLLVFFSFRTLHFLVWNCYFILFLLIIYLATLTRQNWLFSVTVTKFLNFLVVFQLMCILKFHLLVVNVNLRRNVISSAAERLDWWKTMPNVVYLNKLTCKRTLRQVFYLSEAPFLPWPHTPLPLTHCIRVYNVRVYLFTQGRGGELTRENVRGEIVHKAGRKYPHDWLYL